MFKDVVDWITYWTTAWGLTAAGWLARTTQWAGDWYIRAVALYTRMWGRLVNLTDFFQYNWIQAAIKLVQAVNDVWGNRFFWLQDLYVNLVTRWRQTFVDWWYRLVEVFDTNWSWVHKWYTDWVKYVTWLFDNYKERIHYALVTDWPKLWWLIAERFEDLHNIFEFHLPGWKTFIDDPGQAIWDWLKPRLQGLVSEFLVEIW